MGRIGLVLGFERRGRSSEVKVDLGGNNVVTATYYGPPGDDAYPLKGDYAFLTPAPGTGKWVAEGFADPKIAGEAGEGERIVYSRSAPGVIAAKIHLKRDGSVVINDKAIISPSGDDITVDGISLKSHKHGYIDSQGDPPVPVPSDTTEPEGVATP